MLFKNYQILFIIFVLTLLLPSCAPVFSDLQSARTAGKNNLEVIPSYSTVSKTDDGQTNKIQNHLGMQAAFGVDSNVDVRVRYEYIWLKDDSFSNGTSVLGAGFKIGILKNHIAFSMMTGRSLGENSDDIWQLHPAIHFSYPAIKDIAEVNFSTKYLIVICQDCDNLVAFNLGLSLSNNTSRWSIRPEYGWLLNPATSGYHGQFSIGVAGALGK